MLFHRQATRNQLTYSESSMLAGWKKEGERGIIQMENDDVWLSQLKMMMMIILLSSSQDYHHHSSSSEGRERSQWLYWQADNMPAMFPSLPSQAGRHIILFSSSSPFLLSSHTQRQPTFFTNNTQHSLCKSLKGRERELLQAMCPVCECKVGRVELRNRKTENNELSPSHERRKERFKAFPPFWHGMAWLAEKRISPSL